MVRLSGPQATDIAAAIVDRTPQWRAWSAALGRLVDEAGRPIDRVVLTYFAAPKSYTAEDMVEIACHGSPVVTRLCLDRALAAGARLAKPGEFTLRAFVNGRIDLPQAEAVRDLIESTTLYQARIAARQAEGSVAAAIEPAKEQLLNLIARLEAGIDFAEDDITIAPDVELMRRLAPVREAVATLARSFDFGRLVHDGMTLAIAGRPNVGKSSLFNRLLEQDRAIVTEIAGTTRDLVSETAAIRGIPVKLVDTAGVRESADRIESLGIARSFQAMADADLTLVVIDLSERRTADDDQLIERARSHGRHLVVGNKCDLAPAATEPRPEGAVVLPVSAKTGQGIDALRDAIIPHASAAGDDGFITSARQARLLTESLESLDRARTAINEKIPHEMLLLDLYSALRPIDEITGATTADDILNRIFSTFCIGK